MTSHNPCACDFASSETVLKRNLQNKINDLNDLTLNVFLKYDYFSQSLLIVETLAISSKLRRLHELISIDV